MGLFSFLNKNKQETAGDDGGYISRDDDADAAARARSKRASNAGDPAAKRGKAARDAAADPVLPEKKRARRRLVGAIALALAVAVGLPMILDAEEKPRSNDIDIRIPSKENAAALPMPAAVPVAESLDKREEIVEAPQAVAVPAAKPAAPPPLVTLPRDVAEVKVPAAKPEVKTVAKPADKSVVKAAEAKPALPKADAERALAILEGKPVAPPAAPKYTVQVAALSSQEKVNELMAKLKAEGVPASTQKNGELIRVKVGPFNKEDSDRIRGKLDKLGLSGKAVPN
ncbi:MAG: SPOR domain-containing protein [Telluria sp.]|nr:SPOR domain-containing protein [Telluria sp.]